MVTVCSVSFLPLPTRETAKPARAASSTGSVSGLVDGAVWAKAANENQSKLAALPIRRIIFASRSMCGLGRDRSPDEFGKIARRPHSFRLIAIPHVSARVAPVDHAAFELRIHARNRLI